MRVRLPCQQLPVRRAAGVVLAAVTMAAGVGVWGAHAESAGVTLQYMCTLAGLPSQPMTAELAWNAPSSVMVGRAMPTTTIDATATVGPNVTLALGLIGAATVEGSVDAPGVVVAPQGNVSAAVRLTVQRTDVPPSGSMTVQATGTTPGIVFDQPGHATVTVGNSLALQFTPRDANGNPTAAGSLDLSCALDSGQNTTVFAFDITPVPVPIPAPAKPVHPSVGGTPGTGAQGRAAPGLAGSQPSPGGSTPSNTTVSGTAQPTVSATVPPTAATTTVVHGSAVAPAVVRNAGPTAVGWWLVIAGILATIAGAASVTWLLFRQRGRFR